MSQPPAAVPGPPRCGCRSPPLCPCASRPPRQISCRTATARQRYIWTGFAWRMWNKSSFFPEAEEAPQTSQARPAPPQGRWPSDSDGRRGFATRQRECFLLYSVSFPHASHAHTRPHRPNRPMPMPVSRSGRVSIPRAASKQGLGQLQSGAEQERARPRRVERMPAGQTRHKKNFDQHHSQ